MDPNQNFDWNMFNFVMKNPQFWNQNPNSNTPSTNPPLPNFFNPNYPNPNFCSPNPSLSNPIFAPPNTLPQDPPTPASNTGSNSETQTQLFSQENLENIDTPIPTPTAVGRKGKKKLSTPSRRNVKIWSVADDKLLASAYLNVSKDPIVEINQPGLCYWQRLTDFYNDNRHKDTQVERERNSCKQHWYTINAICNKFKGCYAKFEGRSGFNEARIMSEALDLYEATYNCKFPYDHIWYSLKDEPKWSDDATQYSNTKRSKLFEDGSYTSSGPNCDDEEDVEEVRPMGQKAAKKVEQAKRKGKNIVNEHQSKYDTALILEEFEEKRSVNAQAFMKEREKDSALRERELEAQLKTASIREREIETQLLTADVTKLSRIQRKIYDLKMKEMAIANGWDVEDEDED